MTQENAVVSFSARSIHFDASNMILTIQQRDADAIELALSERQYVDVSAVCNRYMHERHAVVSALQHAIRASKSIDDKDALHTAIKRYDNALNDSMRSEVKLILCI